MNVSVRKPWLRMQPSCEIWACQCDKLLDRAGKSDAKRAETATHHMTTMERARAIAIAKQTMMVMGTRRTIFDKGTTSTGPAPGIKTAATRGQPLRTMMTPTPTIFRLVMASRAHIHPQLALAASTLEQRSGWKPAALSRVPSRLMLQLVRLRSTAHWRRSRQEQRLPESTSSCCCTCGKRLMLISERRLWLGTSASVQFIRCAFLPWAARAECARNEACS
mmetsp:Transcript_10330/g.30629  ORF Transcript_10330/g.30629 Transcript_10330/m.30629 type:complete len:221 (-) Transcript_10330:2333-2995(-)